MDNMFDQLNLVKYYDLKNLEEIKNELFEYSDNLPMYDLENPNYFNLNPRKLNDFPNLSKAIKDNFIVSPTILKFYIMPPNSYMKPHIDGTFNRPTYFGFNMPIYNCETSETIFYDCAEDNLTETNNINNQQARIPKNSNKMVEIKRYILNSPCFVYTNKMHSVRNNTNKKRIMFLMRWSYIKSYEQILKI